jgi:hypothetical protein
MQPNSAFKSRFGREPCGFFNLRFSPLARAYVLSVREPAHAEAALGVVEGDPLKEPGEHFLGQRLSRGRTGSVDKHAMSIVKKLSPHRQRMSAFCAKQPAGVDADGSGHVGHLGAE